MRTTQVSRGGRWLEKRATVMIQDEPFCARALYLVDAGCGAFPGSTPGRVCAGRSTTGRCASLLSVAYFCFSHLNVHCLYSLLLHVLSLCTHARLQRRAALLKGRQRDARGSSRTRARRASIWFGTRTSSRTSRGMNTPSGNIARSPIGNTERSPMRVMITPWHALSSRTLVPQVNRFFSLKACRLSTDSF